jgi:hypothetical protein
MTLFQFDELLVAAERSEAAMCPLWPKPLSLALERIVVSIN